MSRNFRRGVLGTVALLGLGLGACTDPSVEPTSTVSETTVFNSPSSYRAFLAKLYGGLILSGIRGCCDRDIGTINDAGFQSYIRIYWQAQELPTDEAMLRWANDGPILEYNAMTWGSTNEFVSGMFARIFFQISTANEFLRQTTDAKLDERGVSGQLRADIQTFRAEARFLRALSYWHGVDMYGPIPIVTEPSGTPPAQATRQQVFDFIVSELNSIIPDLPAAAGQGTYARATQEAAHMLLAHVYLNGEIYTGTAYYTEAANEAAAVINSGKFSLNPVFQNNFTADNHLSPEIIFPLVSDGLFSRGYGGTTFLIHAACVGGTNPWSQDPATLGVNGCWAGLKVRPEAYARLQSDPRGLFFTTGRTPNVITSITSEEEGAASMKFTNLTSTGSQGSSGEFPDTDFPMFRLADAY
ncbi:MAG: RagB/SusD family nutrient uptake outer membrane protein, partial [Gemmatimonadota bacterium]|nr:RagB/SusD family nutrient uptake outer membrane protein [Gemmatimonadota bacterium]